MNEYIAIDVETANPNLASICQIGAARFSHGECVDKFVILINPNDYFDDFNISVHGIYSEDVKNSPAFPNAYNKLLEFIGNGIVVSHTGFDKSALSQACRKHGLDFFNNEWVDTARVARRVWDFCRDKGYGLKKLCKKFKISLDHHDALSDACASGEILSKAINDSGLSLQELMDRVKKPIINVELVDSNPDGDLYGECIVFTGTLSVTRREAENMAAHAGCTIHESVKKTTNILVVGDVDLSKLAGFEKSSKHRKAEELISQGADIRIISESNFNVLVNKEG
ncbi:DNA polymerase III polC-type [Serratia fonticola]|uniref:exonuclease domain-containing protein n=1 Tax=Serratia fonticola TaxID=47917 RepID=UPI0021775AD6|nr:exonuclease domain-containing protein [Serratia fonticola]CAI0851962.1 DNA polymerase III polC-type [Serratia fonticola]CAI1137670.1 DNA polymerase III polC-type [Serratia fonticola]